MKNKKIFGRIESNTPVIISNANEKDVGKIIDVRIKDFNRNSLFGIKENGKEEAAMLEAKNLDKEISVKKIDNETINVKILCNILIAVR